MMTLLALGNIVTFGVVLLGIMAFVVFAFISLLLFEISADNQGTRAAFFFIAAILWVALWVTAFIQLAGSLSK